MKKIKSWEYLIDRGDTAPDEQEQKDAVSKFQRNYKNLIIDKELEPTSVREEWADYLYKKNQKASPKSRKKWQILIDNKDTPPTKDEQNKANAKRSKNSRNKRKGKKLEPISIREQWAIHLYGKNSNDSSKSRKASVENREEAIKKYYKQ